MHVMSFNHISQLAREMARVPMRLRLMTTPTFSFFIFFFLHLQLQLLVASASVVLTSSTTGSSRHDFPPGFVFGAGSSAYQVEGAAAEDGRKPSVWDTFTHAGKSKNNSTGDIASDQYHKYKEDVKLMHEMGLDAYKLSISWSRLIPDGHGAVNPKGSNYYNNLIDELLRNRTSRYSQPFHVPQSLQDEYEGYLSPKFIGDFTAYADICFQEYGNRVKSWITFCEPNMDVVMGTDAGIVPPGRCSYPFGNCSKGNSTTEPYLAAHNILLSHAAAAQLYRTKYQEKQRGQIGITLLALWFEPFTYSPKDISATERMIDFHLGWYLDPIVYGHYPAIMRKIVGSRLPVFTEDELKQLKGSFDFIGFNCYGTLYVQDLPINLHNYNRDYMADTGAKISFSKKKNAMDFPRLKGNTEPRDLQRVLEFVKQKYQNPAVFIHENGYQTTIDDSSNHRARNDTGRIKYLQKNIEALHLSVRNGSNARGYFVWAFMDCFEWIDGYTAHFGLYGVDFNDKDRKRYPRMSAHWYSSFLSNNGRKPQTPTYLFSE